MTWWELSNRFVYEANDDTGEAAEYEDDDGDELPDDAAAETAETDDAEDAPEGDVAAQEAEDFWQAYRDNPAYASLIERANGDVGQLLENSRNLELFLSQRQAAEAAAAAAAEAEEPEPFDPWDALSVGTDPDLRDRVYAAAEHDLPGTAKQVIQNREHFGQDLAGLLYQAWFQHDPFSAQMFVNELTMEEQAARLRSEMQEMIQPYAKSTAETWIGAAMSAASQQIADLDTYKLEIATMLEQNPQWLAGTHGNVQAMALRLVQMRDIVHAAHERQAATSKPRTPAKPKPQTLGGGAAPAAGDPNEDFVRRMREVRVPTGAY